LFFLQKGSKDFEISDFIDYPTKGEVIGEGEEEIEGEGARGRGRGRCRGRGMYTNRYYL